MPKKNPDSHFQYKYIMKLKSIKARLVLSKHVVALYLLTLFSYQMLSTLVQTYTIFFSYACMHACKNDKKREGWSVSGEDTYSN